MSLLSKIALVTLLALTVVVLYTNAQSLYTTPVPNTWIWFSGDETQSMVEERALLERGYDTYWYAHTNEVARGAGILKGSVWLVALLYAGPSLLLHSNFVFVGRTVSALLALVLLGCVYWASKKLGARTTIAIAGVLLLAASTCFFVMSHSARPDIPVGIANLLLMVFAVEAVATPEKAEEARKGLFVGGVLFAGTLLVSLHVAMDTTFPLVFILWRGRALRSIKDFVRFCAGFAAVFAILTAAYVMATGTFSLLGSFLPKPSMFPVHNILHPRADWSTVILTLFHMREWIPYFLLSSIALLVLILLLRVMPERRERLRLSTAQRVWIEALPIFILSWVLFEAREARYLIFIVPVFTVTIAFLAERVWETVASRAWRRGLIAACSAGLVFMVWQSMVRFTAMQEIGERISSTNERISEQVYSAILNDAGPRPGSLRTMLTMPAMLRLSQRAHIDPCLPDLGDSEYSSGHALDKLHGRGVRYIVTCTSSLIRDTYEDDENIENMPKNEVEPIAEFHAIYSDVGRNYSEDMYVGMDTVRVYKVR